MTKFDKKLKPSIPIYKNNLMRRVSVEIVKTTTSERAMCLKCMNLFVLAWLLSLLFVFIMVVYLKDFIVPAPDIGEAEDEMKIFNLFHQDDQLAYNADGLESKLNKSLMGFLSSLNVDTDDKKAKSSGKQLCSSEKNIVFIKTHKTASSTVTNILNRYADLQELTVALPSMGDIRFSWPRKFHWSNVDLLRLDGQPANILVNHARYHRHEMNLIMEENAKYITILRHPISQFESSFYYFEFDKLLGLKNKSNPIEVFLHNPDEYIYNLTLLLGDLPETMNLIQSGMIYDLGYDFMDLEPDPSIRGFLKKLERELALVMIMEYFDESLVLMKREFCWELDDILYIKQNQRLRHINLTKDLKEKILQWNHADVMLYNHFNKTLWKKINLHGDEFWKEVREFRQRNKDFEKICSPQKVTTKGFKINVDVSSFVMNPTVDRHNRYLCEKVLMTEVDYLNYFRKKFGANFGYQRILMAEGIRSLNRTNILSERMKKYALETNSKGRWKKKRKINKIRLPKEVRKWLVGGDIGHLYLA